MPILVLRRKAIVAVGLALFPEGRSTQGGQDRGGLRDQEAVFSVVKSSMGEIESDALRIEVLGGRKVLARMLQQQRKGREVVCRRQVVVMRQRLKVCDQISP